MSLRSPHAVAVDNAGHESRLAHVLSVGQQHQKARTTPRKVTSASVDQRTEDAIRRAGHSSHTVSMGSVVLSILGPPTPKPPAVAASIVRLTDRVARLGVDQADTDVNTGKRKVDRSLAAARVGTTTTQRWANERFRQVMLLVLEFRKEWPNNSLLTADDVDQISFALDAALLIATSTGVVANIYDLNSTVWAIYLVQRAHTQKVGSWTVESTAAQQRLTFQALYEWLEGRHSLHRRHDLRDSLTKQVVHKYVLPFKRMKMPPDKTNMFKLRKGANRLSDWIVRGSAGGQVGLAAGIIEMQPPTIVAPPPDTAAREARANTAWARGRAAQQRRSRTLRSVVGDSEDAVDTRRVVDAVMQASGTYSTSDSDDEFAGEVEREMEAEEGDGGAGPSQNAGGASLEDIQNEFMRDSDIENTLDGFERQIEDEEGADGGADRRGSSGGNNTAGTGGGAGLSEYERERLENIARNKARLRELGLDDPLVPPRPRPAPRQPRPPRAPDGPRRESSRLQTLPRRQYTEAEHSGDDDEEEAEESLEGQVEESPPEQVQNQPPAEPVPPRRSTRVPNSSGSETFSQQTKTTIRDALATSTLQDTGLEIIHFMSATQLPRNRINTVGVAGDAEELDHREGSVKILVSLQIRDFLSNVLAYRSTLLWKWIAYLEGLDITALLYRGEVIGAAIGFYSEEEHVYITHMTAVHRNLQGGAGVGLFLRRQQLQHLQQRLGPGHGPLEVVSLSANRDGENRGAVQFQRHVFTQMLGFEELRSALPIVQRIAEAAPELGLDHIMMQKITPLRFRQIVRPAMRFSGGAV